MNWFIKLMKRKIQTRVLSFVVIGIWITSILSLCFSYFVISTILWILGFLGLMWDKRLDQKGE